MRTLLTLIALPLAWVAACGDNASPDAGSGGGGASTAHAGSLSGGASSAGTSSASAGKASGSAGAAGSAPGAGNTGAGQAGTTSGGGNGGALAGAGTGTGGGGGGGDTACTRELLKATVDAYFKALAAHDPGMLPLADSVKLTENGKAGKAGDLGLWKTAGALKYVHSALDTDSCQSASEAVVPDGTTDLPVALRLKLVSQKITEIETIAVRSGDYSLASNTAGLSGSDTTIMWEQAVAADERATRDDLTGWMTKYYTQFPKGVCNTTSTCKRIENGAGSFVCSEGAGCDATPPATPVLKTRLVLADVDAGLGVGFTLFTGGYTDMHMFKMYGGQVYAVSAILAKADSTGWD